MNLSELTPDEQRARIEGWLRTYAGCIGPDYFAAQNIEFLCRLALRALPKVEWRREGSHTAIWSAKVLGHYLEVWEIDEDLWGWSCNEDEDTAPTLEAAQKDCVDALWKLIGGEDVG